MASFRAAKVPVCANRQTSMLVWRVYPPLTRLWRVTAEVPPYQKRQYPPLMAKWRDIADVRLVTARQIRVYPPTRLRQLSPLVDVMSAAGWRQQTTYQIGEKTTSACRGRLLKAGLVKNPGVHLPKLADITCYIFSSRGNSGTVWLNFDSVYLDEYWSKWHQLWRTARYIKLLRCVQIWQ